ncbi:MAG: arginase family protein [Phycisphaeraceae bacterium]|nr:arginase family protein [Phycisphaeraceae bacterium]
MPDDLGVHLNNGRPGAREGPHAIRDALSRYGVASQFLCELPAVFDAGDVVPAEGQDAQALARTHDRVSEATEALARRGMLVIGFGGGHDLTYALVRGVARARGSLMPGIYFDAHLDVRDTPGSGMSFRRLLDENIASNLRIVGFNPLVNQREHAEWFIKHRGVIAPAGSDPLGGIDTNGGFVSVDLDCVDMGAAPGVSAPNPAGLGPRELADAMERLGQHYNLRCLDFMELCPPHDEGGRTARLAAHLLLSFLRGIGLRTASVKQ